MKDKKNWIELGFKVVAAFLTVGISMIIPWIVKKVKIKKHGLGGLFDSEMTHNDRKQLQKEEEEKKLQEV